MLTDVRQIQPYTTERITLLIGDELIQKIDALGLESTRIATKKIQTNCTLNTFVGGAAW
jgi:hypothetical protein